MRPLFSTSIHDCKVDTFRCPGKGGQNVNKRETGVRVTHEPSGAIGKSCEERSQHQNKVTAFRRMGMCHEFQRWARIEAARRSGKPSIEETVDQMLQERNIKTEVKDEKGRWVDA